MRVVNLTCTRKGSTLGAVRRPMQVIYLILIRNGQPSKSMNKLSFEARETFKAQPGLNACDAFLT